MSFSKGGWEGLGIGMAIAFFGIFVLFGAGLCILILAIQKRSAMT